VLSQANVTSFPLDDNITTVVATSNQVTIDLVRNITKQLDQQPSSNGKVTIDEFKIGALEVFLITSETNVLATVAFASSKCVTKAAPHQKGCLINSKCTTIQSTLSQKQASIGASVGVSAGVTGVGACFVLIFVLLCYRRKKTTLKGNDVFTLKGDDQKEEPTAVFGFGGEQTNEVENPLFA